MGCRKCLKDIYPGFETTTIELFGQYQLNDHIFNPFDFSHDINYVGDTSDDENYDYIAWGGCSNLLNNCKYSKPCEIGESRDHELKIFSLNIRSLNSKITELRDNISHYAKFDATFFALTKPIVTRKNCLLGGLNSF